MGWKIRLFPDGEGDPPAEIRRSSEDRGNLLSTPELAKELVAVVSDFGKRLMALTEKSKTTESADEHKELSRAVTHVTWETGARFLHPAYRRHPELIPEEKVKLL